MSCGHEAPPPEATPPSGECPGFQGTRYLSSTGLLVTGFLVALLLFAAEGPEPLVNAGVPDSPARDVSGGSILKMLKTGVPPAGTTTAELMQSLQLLASSDPSVAYASHPYTVFWQNSNANTKREIILLINEYADDPSLPNLVDVAYPFLGIILLMGGETDEDFVRRMFGSLAWMGEDRGLGSITRLIAESLILQGVSPELEARIRKVVDL